MNYNEFIQCVCEKVQERYQGKAEVKLNHVDKNNGVNLWGITVTQTNHNISPTIYLERFFDEYNNGMKLDNIISQVTEIYENCKVEEKIDMDFFLNFELIQQKIVYKLISAEKNTELLKKIPHVLFLDLAVVFYATVDNTGFGNASILIRNTHLDMWKTNTDELMRIAKENTPKLLPYEIKDLESLVKSMFIGSLKDDFLNSVKKNSGEDIEVEFPEDWMDSVADKMVSENTEFKDGGMYVITNKTKLFGAATILYEGVLTSFADQTKSDLYLLPSSIHEIIMLPAKNGMNGNELKKMVEEVNETQLEDEDILSDNVYFFSREKQSVALCCN